MTPEQLDRLRASVGQIHSAVRVPQIGPTLGDIESQRPWVAGTVGSPAYDAESAIRRVRRSFRWACAAFGLALAGLAAAIYYQHRQIVELRQSLAATQGALVATASVAFDSRAARELSALLGLAIEVWETTEMATEMESRPEGLRQ